MSRYLFTLLFLTALFASLFSQRENYEGYYFLNKIAPDDDDAFWFPDNTEIQGVTNDGKSWFFTVTGHEDAGGPDKWAKLWKIPKDIKLNSSSSPSSGVSSISMFDIPDLNIGEYWHWGDPDHYNHNGVEYILVPATASKPNPNGRIACFRASDLKYISCAKIINRKPGWIAINEDGRLFTSITRTSEIDEYKVDWDAITTPNSSSTLLYQDSYNLNFSTSNYTRLEVVQGGEFSESNELLYLVSGSGGCWGWGPGEPEPSDGIHAFDTSNWAEIETSIKNPNFNDHFRYTFDNNCDGFFNSMSPQGLTVWDIENTGYEANRGNLHVLLFHYDTFLGNGPHDISVFHYTNNIYVDSNSSNPLAYPIGRKDFPFKIFNDAFNFYPVWDGAEIRLKAGFYSDKGVYKERVKITSEGGSAVIGKQ